MNLSTSPNPVFDPAVVLESLDDDRELVLELIDLFLTEAPQSLLEIRRAIAGGDSRALDRAAHKLKGSLSIFGQKAAFEQARRLEELGREGQLTDAEAAFPMLTVEMDRLNHALTEFKESG